MEMDIVYNLHDKFGDVDFSDTRHWKLDKLRQIREYRKRNEMIVGKNMRYFKTKLRQISIDEFLSGVKNTDRKQRDAMKKGYDPRKIADPVDIFGLNERKLDGLLTAIDGDFENAKNAVLRQADDVYRQTIFRTLVEINTGALTLPQAIDRATNQFLSTGLNSITYKNGRRVNIAAYSEMYLRTASKRAFLLGEGARREEWGESLVIISRKNVACPKCVHWLGVVCVDDVYSGKVSRDYHDKYPLMSEAMAQGFLHPNCKDTFTGFYEGITAIQVPLTQDEVNERIRVYDLQQKQRENETGIRKAKREAAGKVDPVNKKAAEKKVRVLQARQREFIDETNAEEGREVLRRTYTREKLRV
jgi:hypothetical protein